MGLKKFAVLLVVIGLVLGFGMKITASAEIYPLTTVVISVNYDTDEVIVEDFVGNEWVFKGCEDWQVYDVVSMIMDDMDSDLIYDDVILQVRYSGWLEGWK